ncbi:MAG: right-handed parallel beta-helix repeat-containing protein [Victivallales bacterium]|nr:right-handed parallel beta-helix repeat-containing protein [Victivallales bacterium]
MNKTNKVIFILFLVTISLQSKTLYVSPQGDDTAIGSEEKPLASLDGARRRVRQLRVQGVKEEITVLFEDGVYPLKEPVRFTPLDSGTGQGKTVYKALDGKSVIFDGGRHVTNIEVMSNGHWRAFIPEVAEGKVYYEQLYVNGEHAIRARTPNVQKPWDYFYIRRPIERGRNPLTGNRENLSHTAFYAEKDDIAPLAGYSQKDLNDIVLVAYHSWETSRQRLAVVDGKTGFVMATGGMAWPYMRWGGRQRYHLENYREALDAEHEWFLGRDGWLEYIPDPDQKPNTTELVFPVTSSFMEIEGDEDMGLYVSNIAFEGLMFRHSGYILPPHGHSCGQAEMDIPAVVHLVNATGIDFRNCEIGAIGTYGIHFDKGCYNNSLRQCWIHDMGAGGVKIGVGWGVRVPSEELAVRKQTIDNCIIQSGGRIHHGAIGVWIGHSCDNVVTHNDIGDLFYTGISVGWTWGYAPTVSVRNKIEFNHIHDIGQGVLSDMGGVYTLGYAKGTTVSNNYIHHVYSYDYYGAGGQGLYTDEGSAEIVMENNLVHHVRSGCFHQHYGRDNIIRNNILAFSMNGQIQRSRIEDHRSFAFTNNIVYWDNKSPLFSRKTTDEHVEVHHNMYWNTADAVTFNGLSFEDWKKTGHGDGDVIEDPLFVDPEHGDFHFRAGSPYEKIGFKPFDYIKAGVYGDMAWIKKALTLQVADVQLTPPPPPRPFEILDGGFEEYDEGEKPMDATVYADNQPLIRVTSDNARHGKKCLKVSDKPGLSAKYNPHFHYNPHLKDGVATLEFDISIDEKLVYYIEMREYPSGKNFITGPSISFENGALIHKDGDKQTTLMKMPPRKWFHIAMKTDLGDNPKETFELMVTPDGGEPKSFTLKKMNKNMKHLDWFGFVADGEDFADCWLDNIQLKVVSE